MSAEINQADRIEARIREARACILLNFRQMNQTVDEAIGGDSWKGYLKSVNYWVEEMDKMKDLQLSKEQRAAKAVFGYITGTKVDHSIVEEHRIAEIIKESFERSQQLDSK